MERHTPAPPSRYPAPEALRAIRCANCDITVTEDPFERDGRIYCCEGCSIGGPCIC